MSDISKLLFYVIHKPLGEWNSRQFWNITSGIYAKYHVKILLLFVYTTSHKRFVIFTCRYFKLSWNITALSQSNGRNFSCSCTIQYNYTVYFNTRKYLFWKLSRKEHRFNKFRAVTCWRKGGHYFIWNKNIPSLPGNTFSLILIKINFATFLGKRKLTKC